jgi:hypothetical protein
VYPRLHRKLNTGEEQARATRMIKTTNAIYHGPGASLGADPARRPIKRLASPHFPDGSSRLNFEAHQAHQLQRVALRDDPFPQFVVKIHFPVFNLIFEVHVAHKAVCGIGDFG